MPDQVCPISFQLDAREDVRSEAPSKLILEFTLRTCRGDPVPGLDQSHLKFYEDGALISAYESARDVQNPVRAYEFESLLLLDMSAARFARATCPRCWTPRRALWKTLRPAKRWRSMNAPVSLYPGKREVMRTVRRSGHTDGFTGGCTTP